MSPTNLNIANQLESLAMNFVLDRRTIGCPLCPSMLPFQLLSGLSLTADRQK